MKHITGLVLSLLMVLFLSACGSGNSSDDTSYTFEVNGPAGNFAGASEFDPAMLADWQTIYTFDEKDNIWIGVVFSPDGNIIYESVNGITDGGTYSIVVGKLLIVNNEKSTTISLTDAKSTVWDVAGLDWDGKNWNDTWYLELKFKPGLIVGKKFISEFTDRGTQVQEKLVFTENEFLVYTMDDTLKHNYSYTIKDNTMVVSDGNSEFTLYLMFVDYEGRYHVWYKSEADNYANNSAWTPE